MTIAPSVGCVTLPMDLITTKIGMEFIISGKVGSPKFLKLFLKFSFFNFFFSIFFSIFFLNFFLKTWERCNKENKKEKGKNRKEKTNKYNAIMESRKKGDQSKAYCVELLFHLRQTCENGGTKSL